VEEWGCKEYESLRVYYTVWCAGIDPCLQDAVRRKTWINDTTTLSISDAFS